MTTYSFSVKDPSNLYPIFFIKNNYKDLSIGFKGPKAKFKKLDSKEFKLKRINGEYNIEYKGSFPFGQKLIVTDEV
jgi:hypothetical protein